MRSAIIFLFTLCLSSMVWAQSIEFTTPLVEFGTVAIGSSPEQKTLVLKNTHTEFINVGNCQVSFGFTADPTGAFTVLAGNKVDIKITYPVSTEIGDHPGFYRCKLSTGRIIETKLHLKIVEQITVNPVSINFGSVLRGTTQTVPISIKSNVTGTGLAGVLAVTLNVTSPNVSRALPQPFKADKTSFSLNAQATQTIQVTMTAGDIAGPLTGTLEISFQKSTSAAPRKITVPLSGTVLTK